MDVISRRNILDFAIALTITCLALNGMTIYN